MNKTKIKIPDDIVLGKIYLIRDQKVMLDRDLSELYGIETKQLKRAVRRNIDRFPEDFMFELNNQELDNLRSQFGTSSWGGSRYLPMVFTEQGVAMLSSVLNSVNKKTQNLAFPARALLFPKGINPLCVREIPFRGLRGKRWKFLNSFAH